MNPVPADREQPGPGTDEERQCDENCQKWNLDRNLLEMEMPSLRVLRLAAHPESASAKQKAPLAIFGFIAVVALPFFIGAWAGLFTVGRHWIHHMLGG